MIGRVNTGGGGSGGTLVVTAPVGVTVTATKDGKSYVRTANAQGKATFKGLKTGTWNVSIDDAAHDPTVPVPVTITADYAVTVAFFSATINITYPSGSTCKVTKGDIEFTAPDASGAWSCVVPESGTWTVTATDGEKTKSVSVEITVEGQCENVMLSYRLDILVSGNITSEDWLVYYLEASFGYIKSEYIEIGSTDGWGSSLAKFVSNNAYSLSGYSTLNFDIECNKTGDFNLGIATDNSNNTNFVAYSRVTATGRQIISLNVSEMGSQSYYVKGTQTAWPVSQYIYNIWLE